MGTNSEIYLIGVAVLFFLIIVFLFIKKISNSGKLKVKIESVPDSLDSSEEESAVQNQKTFEFNINKEEQELAVLNLISVDRSMFDIEPVSYTHLTLPTKRIV